MITQSPRAGDPRSTASTRRPTPPLTTWEVLARPSIPNPALTWADYLVSLDPPPESPFARLAELRASLDRLAGLSTAELDRLLTETLDACSHRLDVWASAIANAILQRQRSSQQAQGLHLGGFGWVEEVRPAPLPTQIAGAELQSVRALDQRRAQRLQLQAALPVPVQPAQDNGGYILAPSLAQASVAAVLRNGYMTHKGTSDEGLLSIDLSSERVRKALYAAGGRAGGAEPERAAGLSFRRRPARAATWTSTRSPFATVSRWLPTSSLPSSDPSESVAASNVVDGVALRTAWDTGQLPAGGSWGSEPARARRRPERDHRTAASARRLRRRTRRPLHLGSRLPDHARQLRSRRNACWTRSPKASGRPTPDVVNTPRGGIDLTHRVALLFAGNATVNPPWSGVSMRPRAAAEPWVDAWLSDLLPDPASVVCTVKYHDGGRRSFAPGFAARSRCASAGRAGHGRCRQHAAERRTGIADFLRGSTARRCQQRCHRLHRIRRQDRLRRCDVPSEIAAHAGEFGTGADAAGHDRARGRLLATAGGAVDLVDLRARASAARRQPAKRSQRA